MKTTVDIPGGTATFRDHEDLRVRHQRLVQSAALAAAPLLARMPKDVTEETAITDLPMSRQEAATLFELQDATIVALLESWTIPDELPTMDTMGDLDAGVYDALVAGTRTLGLSALVGTDFTPSKIESGSPTPDSASSDGPSKAEAESTSTEIPPTGGESIAIGSSTPA